MQLWLQRYGSSSNTAEMC